MKNTSIKNLIVMFACATLAVGCLVTEQETNDTIYLGQLNNAGMGPNGGGAGYALSSKADSLACINGTSECLVFNGEVNSSDQHDFWLLRSANEAASVGLKITTFPTAASNISVTAQKCTKSDAATWADCPTANRVAMDTTGYIGPIPTPNSQIKTFFTNIGGSRLFMVHIHYQSGVTTPYNMEWNTAIQTIDVSGADGTCNAACIQAILNIFHWL